MQSCGNRGKERRKIGAKRLLAALVVSMVATEIEDRHIVPKVVACADRTIAPEMANASQVQIVVSNKPTDPACFFHALRVAVLQNALIASASALGSIAPLTVNAFVRILARATLEAHAGFGSARSSVAPQGAIVAFVDVTKAFAPKTGFAFSKRLTSMPTSTV